MFKLAHISDIHLGPMPKVSIGQLFSKRLTGYLNWKLNRKGEIQNNTLSQLIAHLKKSNPDHLAITGDLVNLALPAELSRMRNWLEALSTPVDASVILGNHDAYVPGSVNAAVNAWQPYLEGDCGLNSPVFPYRRDRRNISILGVNSAQATLPFMATGYFRPDQAERLAQFLDETKQEGRFRVVMIHHPPYENAAPWSKRLIGAELFRKIIKDHGAELVLHGHNHVNSVSWIEGPNKPVAVIGVPAAGQAPRLKKSKTTGRPGGCYNVYSISGAADNWICQLDEYGFADGSNEVSHIGSNDCLNP